MRRRWRSGIAGLVLLVGLWPAAAGASPMGPGAVIERAWQGFWEGVTTFLGVAPAEPAPRSATGKSNRGADKDAPPVDPVVPLGMVPPNPPPTPGDATPGIDPNG